MVMLHNTSGLGAPNAVVGMLTYMGIIGFPANQMIINMNEKQ